MLHSFSHILTSANINYLLKGLLLTLQFSIINILLSFILGLILAIARNYGSKIIKSLVIIYVEIFRNTPLLLWLLFARFALTRAFGIQPYTAVIAMFVCFFASILCEQIRSGINSIPVGQFEASQSQGFTFVQTLRYIIIPQAVKMLIPQLLSTLITIIKDTSYLSTIAIADFMYQARAVMANYITVQDKIACYAIIVLVYFIVNFLLSCLVRYLSSDKRKKNKKYKLKQALN